MRIESKILEYPDARDSNGEEVVSIERWVDELHDMMTSLARELIAQDLQAKFSPSDVVQLTWMEAVRDWDSVHSRRREQVVGWLTTLVRNNIKDMCKAYRKSRKRDIRREATLDIESVQCKSRPDERLRLQEIRNSLHHAMQNMPDEGLLLLRWRLEERLTFSEMGKRLDRSEDAIRMAYNRVLSRLRKELQRNADYRE